MPKLSDPLASVILEEFSEVMRQAADWDDNESRQEGVLRLCLLSSELIDNIGVKRFAVQAQVASAAEKMYQAVELIKTFQWTGGKVPQIVEFATDNIQKRAGSLLEESLPSNSLT